MRDEPSGTARVLIIDDEPAHTEMLQEILAAGGYRTESAASGPGALGRARPDPPDLILLDVGMPMMDGLEVCRQLRADARTAHMPILIVTALGQGQDMEQGLAAGADDYVTKPVDPQDLVARVESLLRVRHLSEELDRTLAYLQELEAVRQSPEFAAAGWPAPRHGGPEGAPHVLLVDDDRFPRDLYADLLGTIGHVPGKSVTPLAAFRFRRPTSPRRSARGAGVGPDVS